MGLSSFCLRLLLSCLLTFSVSSEARNIASVDYRLTPSFRGSRLASLRVDVDFRGHADGRTKLYLPDEWLGQTNLWQDMADLKATGARIVETDNPEQLLLIHRPRARIHLSYRILPKISEPPQAKDGNPAHPVIQRGWFFAIGSTIFVFPETEHPEATGRPRASFAWGPIPKKWTVGSDLDHGATHPLTIDDIANSLVIGGEDMKVVSRGTTRVGVVGSYKFAPGELASDIARIQARERAFWSAPAEPYFVGVVPLAPSPGVGQRGGDGRGDGFALYLSTDIDLASVTFLLAHEHEHSWVPNAIGGVPEGQSEADSWLGEGFADYLAARTLLEENLFSPTQFADWWSTTLLNYANSPVRSAPNSDIAKGYWSDRNLRDLPYIRGAIFAAYLDRRISSATAGQKSLRDALLRMRLLAKSDRRPATQLLAPAVLLEAGLDISDDLKNFIEKGAEITLAPDALGPGFEVQTVNAPAFDRGFDAARTNAAGGVVTGVDPTGPAFAAGLRDGMEILRREGGRPGDGRVELVYRVSDGGRERVIHYQPLGRGTATFQQVKPTCEPAGCSVTKEIGT